MVHLTGLFTAKGLVASGAALLALGGGGAVLASQGVTPAAQAPSIQVPLHSPDGDSPGVSLSPLGQPSLSLLPGTHGFLPGTHGQAVTSAVASCAAALPTGEHGIGSCVSKVASSNGQLHRSGHPHPSPHSSLPAHPTPPVG